MEKAVDLIQQNTRHYAKRQLTWFKRNPSIMWLDGFRLEDQSYILDIAEIINQEETEDE